MSRKSWIQPILLLLITIFGIEQITEAFHVGVKSPTQLLQYKTRQSLVARRLPLSGFDEGAGKVAVLAPRAFTPYNLHLSKGKDDMNSRDSVEIEGESDDSFDAAGFAGYLAPYALALLVSVGITAAFFKFVLMDY